MTMSIALKEKALSFFFSKEKRKKTKTKTKYYNKAISYHVVNFLEKFNNISDKDNFLKFPRNPHVRPGFYVNSLP